MALTFSITGGADATKFTIGASTGVLAFKAAPDFETPGDADANNIYVVEVGVSDGTSTTKQTINVTVTDVVENLPPQITSPATAAVKEGDTAVMTVTATDPDEVVVPPQPSGTIPLSFDDPRFTSPITSSAVSIASGQTRTGLSIREQSGNPSVLMFRNSTLRNSRIDSRECIRIADPQMFTIDGCYARAAMGSPQDHADTIQTYSPSDRGTLMLRNSCFVIQTGHCGLFVADNWTGTIDIQNCVFQGAGQFGVRIHPDVGGDNIIKMKDVFFVGPFANDPILIDVPGTVGGHINIIQLWENVRMATINNGVLVPGAAIPSPATRAETGSKYERPSRKPSKS